MNQDYQVNFENVKSHKCVICGNPSGPELHTCLKCHKSCLPVFENSLKDKHEGSFVILDIKSNCCNYDVETVSRITCSTDCHEKLVRHIEKEVGEYKKVIDQETGISYRVPTREIIEKGLTQKDLSKYPVWTDKKFKRIPVD